MESPELTFNRRILRIVARIVLPYAMFTVGWYVLLHWLEGWGQGQSSGMMYQYIGFVIIAALLLAYHVSREWHAYTLNQLALHHSESRLRLLVDNLPDSYVYQYTQLANGTPRFFYISSGVERLHGISVAAVLDNANVLLGQISPEFMPRLRDAEAASRQALTDFTVEVRVKLVIAGGDG